MVKKADRNRSLTDKLQAYAFRSTKQVVIHILLSFVVALILYFGLLGKLSIDETHFVTITSSVSAASGALLAITIALATFYGLHVTNWRDNLVDELAEARARMRKQMEKSAEQHPEISRKLALLYNESRLYVPGKPINKRKIDDVNKTFLNWAECKDGRQEIDAGDTNTYNSFEIHLGDAIECNYEVYHRLTSLYVVRRYTQTLETFPNLVIGWLIVLILTLGFAIVGSMGIVPKEVGFPLLVIAFWLFLVGGFALVKDVVAVFGILRIQETVFDKAWEAIEKEPTEN